VECLNVCHVVVLQLCTSCLIICHVVACFSGVHGDLYLYQIWSFFYLINKKSAPNQVCSWFGVLCSAGL
jgi:hypothetical protein